ncbi:uncharacterized protein FIESC28_06511 [Fusarium coffeatum]|uniref:Uncharacterized protein n=1 Tax=Fusarium coffeatum TaxID=231269 RepID=A0A366RLT9_9HYPO|nr:uncharacterized protein FIESC28_06511 [Fusarium coffeatum]RBR17275.1 hypothetical protein FIESC28_06511 [Fusarium coffeatum]
MTTISFSMPVPVRRTDSDISPKTIDPPQPRDSNSYDAKVDYFPDSNTVDGSNTSVRASDGDDDSSAHKSSISFAPDPRPDRSSSRESDKTPAPNQDSMVQRKSSTGSVSFRRMTNPKLPQGQPQQMSNHRIRATGQIEPKAALLELDVTPCQERVAWEGKGFGIDIAFTQGYGY